MSTDDGSKTSTENRFLQFIVFGSFLVPFVCIPYIPIRHHLLALRRSVQTLSSDNSLLQRELNNILLNAHLRREETLKLGDQLRDLRAQLDTATKRITDFENARLSSQSEMKEWLSAISQRTAEAEKGNLEREKALQREIDILKKRVDAERIPQGIPQGILRDVSTSLGDTAAFLEEVEIQLGWSHSMPRDRGVERMRQLALKLHTMAQSKPPLNDT